MDRKELIKKLKEFKRKIDKKYRVNTIILFGSRSTDMFKKESDVDLIIVGNFKGHNSLSRVPPLYAYWDIDLPVDFLCYTTKEFERLKYR